MDCDATQERERESSMRKELAVRGAVSVSARRKCPRPKKVCTVGQSRLLKLGKRVSPSEGDGNLQDYEDEGEILPKMLLTSKMATPE